MGSNGGGAFIKMPMSHVGGEALLVINSWGHGGKRELEAGHQETEK